VELVVVKRALFGLNNEIVAELGKLGVPAFGLSGQENHLMEADAVKEAIRRKRPIPPPKYKRLIPFGEGVEVIGHRIDCGGVPDRVVDLAASQAASAAEKQRGCVPVRFFP